MHYTQLTLADGLACLHALLPDVARYDIHFVYLAFKNRGQHFEFHNILHWHDNKHSDMVIYDEIIDPLPPFVGNLIINTVYTNKFGNAPHRVHADDFKEYVRQHVKFFGTVFFNVDVIVFCPDQCRFVLIHHNGLWADAWLRQTKECAQ